ncbi:GxxExxY protein [Prevotella pectinovora]|uniref:GxxExxY protein n=1 Tax=Prevotella pectinovora TaxID=1602169 RepID=UPI00307AFEDA
MLLYEDLTFLIRKAIFNVYNYWGPGLLETIYEKSLMIELETMGLKVECQKHIPVVYRGKEIECDYRLDLLVEDKVIIELKAVENLQPIHKMQLSTYLKITGKRLGILVNFNTSDIIHSIVRIAN